MMYADAAAGRAEASPAGRRLPVRPFTKEGQQ
jgi:hypothetical protein